MTLRRTDGLMNRPLEKAPLEADKRMASRPNLRHYQRIALELAVDVKLPDGSVQSCQLANLSRAGMMLECTPEEMARLVPNHSPVAPRQAVRLSTVFDLPIIALQRVRVHAECDVIHIRRVSRSTFQIGMQFVSFEGYGQDYVNQFVDRNLGQTS